MVPLRFGLAVLLVGALSGASAPEKASYGSYETYTNMTVIDAQVYSAVANIRVYTREVGPAPSHHLHIRARQFYLDLDQTGGGILREMPKAVACGNWSISYQGKYLILQRIDNGTRQIPKVGDLNDNFGQLYHLYPLDRSTTGWLVFLQAEVNQVNQWLEAGGSLDRTHMNWYKRFESPVPC